MFIKTYNVEKLVNEAQLINEINSSVNFSSTCIDITRKGDIYHLSFNRVITSGEEKALATLLAEHYPQAPENVSELLPTSDIDGTRIAVHSSTKPLIDNTVYAVFTGCGDDMSGTGGGGEMLDFYLTPSDETMSVDVEFNPTHGKVWIHEAYMRFVGGGRKDYVDAGIMAKPTNLQQVANKVLLVDDEGFVTFSPNGIGTHGFADTNIVLLPRTFSMDGDWDYDESNPENPLVPNFEGKGEYRINVNERMVHRYVHKIPCYGDCQTYFSLQSSEAARLHTNYFLRVTAYNISKTEWFASCFLEIYRERTIDP
jgi:hypothetical protein